MSRRRRARKTKIASDSRYESPVVARLISTIMKRGKKSLAQRIVYGAIDKSRERIDAVDPLDVLNKALENVPPAPRGQVPPRRRRDLPGADGSAAGAPGRLAMRWIVAIRRQAQGHAAGRRPSPPRSRTPPTARATRSRNAKTPTRWPRPTAPSPISAGNVTMSTVNRTVDNRRHRQGQESRIRRTARSRWSGRATSASPRTSTRARRRRPSASFSTPARSTRWARCTKAPP